MEKRFHTECEFDDSDSFFKCNTEIYHNSNLKEIKNYKIIIPSNLRISDRGIDKVSFIGYCSRGYKPSYDPIIDKILYESYYQVCLKK